MSEDIKAPEDIQMPEDTTNSTERKKKEKPPRTPWQEAESWIVTIIAALLAAALIRMFIFEPVLVDGRSMTNTLQDRDLVWCDKLGYLFNSPQRGDVVICRYPGRSNSVFSIGGSLELVNHTLFVKRVIGVPGDTVTISGGQVFVNGLFVEDPEKMASKPRDNNTWVLGEDEYFVVGDNRGNSHDSRASDVGPISRSAIVGHVKFVFWPISGIRAVK